MKKRINWQNVMLYFQCFLLIFAIILQIQHSIEYKFAAKWNTIIFTSIDERHLGGEISKSDELEKWMSNCKEMIYRTQLQDIYPELSWDKLDNVQIGYYNYDPQMDEGILLGQYLPSTNTIVVTPYTLQQNDYYDVCGTILHELCHVLFTDSKEFTKLQEGAVSVFTENIAKENGFSYTMSAYEEEAIFWEMLCNIFGTKDTVDMFINGTLDERIDRLTFWLGGKKLEAIIYYIGNYDNLDVRSKMPKSYSKDELIMMAQDIICHATRNYANGIRDAVERESILDFCRDALIIPDEYFLEMLQ